MLVLSAKKFPIQQKNIEEFDQTYLNIIDSKTQNVMWKS
jgi:hypothetical protein